MTSEGIIREAIELEREKSRAAAGDSVLECVFDYSITLLQVVLALVEADGQA